MRDIDGRPLRIALVVAVSALALTFTPVISQSSAAQPNPALARRIEPSHVKTPAPFQVAGLFGDDEAEKAAAQREDNQDATIQELRSRVSDLEDSLRRQTGQTEQLTHRVQELNQKLDRMQKDFDYRICTMSAQQMGTDPSAIDCSASGTTQSGGPGNSASGAGFAASGQGTVPPAPAGNANASAGPTRLGAPPGVLGTLPANAGPPPQATNAQPQAAASPTRAEYDNALDLLRHGQNSEAGAAFRAFADAHPKDDLAPQALYWVGSIAYAQRDYDGAVHAFAENLKQYPQSPRGPDSMLKLGQSFLAMNQKKEGCTTLGLLSSKYPNAGADIKEKASAARKASCR